MIGAATILVVEDDVEVRRLVFKTMKSAGYKVKRAGRHGDILRQVFSTRCSLVILGMESIDGSSINILKDLRRWSTVPVIVLSIPLSKADARASSVAGADDHIIKPFSQARLVASVRLVLRSHNTTDQGIKFETDSVTIDFENRIVRKKGKIVELTPTEFSLLWLFVHNAGKLLTTHRILRQIRGPWFESRVRYSRVYVGRLRKKLEDDPDHPQLFQTELGKGYKFVVTQ